MGPFYSWLAWSQLADLVYHAIIALSSSFAKPPAVLSQKMQ